MNLCEQDSGIMDVVSGQFSVLAINPGFSETESLNLFSSYLKVRMRFCRVKDIFSAECVSQCKYFVHHIVNRVV